MEFDFSGLGPGEVTVHSIDVGDIEEREVSCPQDTLAVGESMTCTGSTTATPGQYTNLGTACGDGAGQTVCDEDRSNPFGANPAITIEHQTSGEDAEAVDVSQITVAEENTLACQLGRGVSNKSAFCGGCGVY